MAGNVVSLLNTVINDKAKRDALMQIARFGIIGVVLTAVVALLYDAQVYLWHIDERLAVTLATLVAAVPGYILHSRVSFAGHGGRDRVHIRALRFGVTNLSGYCSNLFFTWLLVTHFAEPKWTPNLAFLFITPLMTFWLNRKWVFA